jgi:Kef-type K+ transport system membrane component KefB
VFPEVAVEALPGDLRKALGSAVLCLKVYAGLGLLHLFTCSCLCQLGERASRFSLPLLVLGVLLRCVALVVVYHAAESMERGRKPALARAAGVLAVLGGAYLLLVSVGPRLIQAGTGRLVVPVAAWLALLLFTGVVAVLGIVGGARTLALLRKPEVERWFRR